MKKVLAAAAFGAFAMSGSLQHANSLAAVEAVLDLIVGDAVACPGGNGGGRGNGHGKGHGGGNGKGGGHGKGHGGVQGGQRWGR